MVLKKVFFGKVFSSLMMAGKCERMIDMCQVIYRYMNLCEWDGKQRKKD